jgi:23S rRNA (guanine745-N1)-methyltransferase
LTGLPQSAALAALACPHCGAELTPVDGALGCPHGHRFDIARQGYVTLLAARSRLDTADSADMVQARVEFLGSGAYDPILDAVAAAAPPGLLLEIGSGPGSYLDRALRRTGGSGIALDSSKHAARRAAALSGVLAVVADAWAPLPVRSEAVDGVLSVFAPRVPAEIERVLRPGGVLVAVAPLPQHLAELRAPLGLLAVDEGKADRLADAVPFPETGRHELVVPLTLDHAAASALVRMGPAARHSTADEIAARVAALPDPVTATAAVTVSVFRK